MSSIIAAIAICSIAETALDSTGFGSADTRVIAASDETAATATGTPPDQKPAVSRTASATRATSPVSRSANKGMAIVDRAKVSVTGRGVLGKPAVAG